ncbi:hypothetical protein [Maricaulis sp. MIT060901]|uniref:hypothetical protein n=1 Tax=Maricaulis sp. MIT060901 TaxID=3096993 RepID=UPI00399BC4DB
MFLAALALSLSLQDQAQPDAQETAIEDALVGAEEDLPPPPPTDAASLIAQIDGAWAAYGNLAGELGARRARERFLAEQLLPVIARNDLDEGAHGAILRETADTIREVEGANTAWAVAQLDPEFFPILYAEQTRMGEQILNWAERDETAEGTIVAALEGVAMMGLIDGPEYARRADSWRVMTGQPQLFGTAETCFNGRVNPGSIEEQVTLDERREALGLPLMVEAWTEDRLARTCDEENGEAEDG